MTARYMSIKDIAEHVGLTVNAVKAHHLRGNLPEPAVQIGLTQSVGFGWSVEAIDAWDAVRPRRS